MTNHNRNKKRPQRIFGMAYYQVAILAILGMCGCVSVFGVFSVIQYTNQSNSEIVIPTPTITKIVTTPTKPPTKTPQPTNTFIPTKTPTASPSYTPTVVFQRNPIEYLPLESEMPSGYKIDASNSEFSEDEQRKIQTLTYTSDYPSIYGTEDAYSVSYTISAYKNNRFAVNFYDFIDEKWVSGGFPNGLNNQPVIPYKVGFEIAGVDRSAAYVATLKGYTVAGALIIVKIQRQNLVATVTLLSHSPSGDQQKVLSNAYYFTSLMVQKFR